MATLSYDIATPGIDRLSDDELMQLAERIKTIMNDYAQHDGTLDAVELVFTAPARSAKAA